jgi:hypothetical protein
MRKRTLSFLLTALLLFSVFPVPAAGGVFSDVPPSHWAAGVIDAAAGLGIMQGVGGNLFGLGTVVTRAEFAAMLTPPVRWEKVSPETPTFRDNADPAQWYFSEIETAVENGAVLADDPLFRPRDPITREEMAVMLVRALGYDTLAADAGGDLSLPFSDVGRNAGYIAVAYDFGIITGKAESSLSGRHPRGRRRRDDGARL